MGLPASLRNSCLSKAALLSGPRRELVPCRAARGAANTYYKNYLRNRQRRGGTFLGPPWHQVAPQWQQQQQQPEPTDQAMGQQLDATLSCAGLLTRSLVAAPVLSTADLQALLQQCLQATSAGPTGFSRTGTNVIAGGGHGCHLTAPVGASPAAAEAAADSGGDATQQQQQPLPLTQVLQPWQLPDFVPADVAESLVPVMKPRRGVSVMPPVITPGEPLMPLPQLPTPQQQQAAGTSSSSSGRQRVLHVLWDISSAHPGGYDPRVVVAQLRRVLGAYGSVASIAAYAVQKMFYWVPEAFMLQYAPQRLPGFKRRQTALQQQRLLQPDGRQQQQQQLESLLGDNESVGPLRCPACGKLRSTYRQLHLHMVQRHKQAAPPLSRLLPASVLAAAAAAAATAASSDAASVSAGSSSSSRQAPPLQQSQQQPQQPDVQWKWSDAARMQNSSTRTLGRVTRYYNSQGLLFVPPSGHQISLKYVLAREGVEMRTVQNQRRAVDVSLANGLQQLLERLLLRDAGAAQAVQDVVVVVSDRAAHAGVLRRLQRAGITTVAVCRKRAQYPGADLQLRWQWVMTGRYDCDGDGGDGN